MENKIDFSISVGTDIEEIARIENIVKRSESFVQKCFLGSEIEYCRSKKYSERHFAVRFCAKEAFAKAVGKACRWHDVEIKNNRLGKPEIILHGKAKEEFLGCKMDVSMSHSRIYATSTVVIVWK